MEARRVTSARQRLIRRSMASLRVPASPTPRAGLSAGLTMDAAMSAERDPVLADGRGVLKVLLVARSATRGRSVPSQGTAVGAAWATLVLPGEGDSEGAAARQHLRTGPRRSFGAHPDPR